MKRMRVLVFLLLVATCRCGLGAAVDTNVTCLGSWSSPVRNQHAIFRGRIAMVDAFVFIDLQEYSGAAGPCLELEWNPYSTVGFDITDALGNPVPIVPSAYSGPALPHCWLKLPPDSTTRLRASPYNGGGRQ